MRELSDHAPRPPALFIGREDELRVFAARSEELRLLLVYGVGGVGKTSFLLHAAEALVAPVAGRLAYHVARPGETLRTLAETVLAQLAIARGAAHPVAALLAAARTAPLVVCLDDAHRLDGAQLIDDLVQLALRREPLWLVLASREALPVSPAAIDHLVVRLAGLDGAAARRLWSALEGLYGPSPAASAELERALASGSVSPLLIKQAFSGPGTAARDALGLDVMPPPDAELLAELCAHRLPVPRRALGADQDPAAVEEALRRLQRRFLVDEVAGGLRPHDVVRESVSRSAWAPGAREHVRCLAWYQDQDAADGRFELEVLHHALGAGHDGLALAILERHASHPGRLFPPSAVVERELSQAIARLGERRPLPLAVRLLQARIRARQGHTAAAAAELSSLARAAGDPDPAIDLEIGHVASIQGDFEQAAGALGRAIASERLDPFSRILALAVRADALRCLGDAARARHAFDDHAELLARAGPVGEGIRRWIEAGLAHDSENYELADQATREASDRMAGAPAALPLLASLARTVAAALGRDGRDAGDLGGVFDDTLFLRLVARLLHVEELHFRGEMSAAAALAASTQASAAASGYRSIGRWSLWLRGESERVLGGGAALLPELPPAIDAAARAGDIRSLVRLQAAHARLLLAHGQPEAARNLAETAVAGAGVGPGTIGRLRAVSAFADAMTGRERRPPRRDDGAQGYDAVEGALAAAELALWDRRPGPARRQAQQLVASALAGGWAWLACRAQLVVAEGAYRGGDLAAAARALAAASEAATARGYAGDAAWAGLLAAGLARASGDVGAAAAHLAAVEAQAARRGLVVEAEAARVARAALGGVAAAGETPGARLAHRLALAEPVTRRLRERSAAYFLTRSHAEEWDGERYEMFVDLVRRRVKVGRSWIDLSRRDALLGMVRALSRQPGAVVPVGTLVSETWGVGYHPLRHHSRVTTSILRLRRLLGAHAIAGHGDGYALAVAGPWAVVEPVENDDSRPRELAVIGIRE